MEITGEVKDIIYQNEINSYTVAEFETQKEEIVIVGYLPFINVGDTLKLMGKIVTHQDYGEQFKVDTFEKIMPQTLGSLERYLSNGTIKGVGPATAKKIVDTFKDETIHILKYEPEKLAQIKGINNEKALVISESFIENWEIWQIVGYLEKFSIGIQNAKNVYKKLGANAIEEIESNPYILIDVANNVDFKKIDKMAIDIGLPYNNDKRIKSGIKYALMCVTLNGHCAVLEENLISFCEEFLSVTEEEIQENLIELKVKEEIIVETRIEDSKVNKSENNIKEINIEEDKQTEEIIRQVENTKVIDEKNWVYLAAFYKAEENIANKINILKNSPNIKKIKNVKQELKKLENTSEIELSEKQKQAIEAINDNNVCIITGGPGTGKTTIIKTIIEMFKSQGKKPVLCAPTGRAAKRMTETTGEEAKTLHRLLEIGKVEEEGSYKSVDYEVAPLDADIVIVDEVSMVDLFLMNYLVKALYQGTKLVLVGDIDQLPSVGPGSILKDLISSNQITTIVLNKIFRQAAKSKIILNAHRVNEGESFLTKEQIQEQNLTNLNEDFFYIREQNQERILYNVISLCKERLKNYGDYDFFKNIQVITSTKKGMLGTKELNKILQKSLNPESEYVAQKQVGDTIYRENDRVMQIKNNYDIFWEKLDKKYESGMGVFNGELGTIIKISEQDKTVTIKFDDEKQADYNFSDLDQIEHAYSITVHKSQRE